MSKIHRMTSSWYELVPWPWDPVATGSEVPPPPLGRRGRQVGICASARAKEEQGGAAAPQALLTLRAAGSVERDARSLYGVWTANANQIRFLVRVKGSESDSASCVQPDGLCERLKPASIRPKGN